ncbi:carbonic anhydrase [Ascoidea rubescens DSM 1968]|uniref:Carbonic anhydrase n=1 Tax=Ascoidea rubescens DSM 1968 TaxID=1344418 RepID=A0A1D2VF74_9ASCO|nr:carbonic anhydrase [Ascoidea rubescens DSM 1968]ODV60163.1 carbonic anhydrase [Ascoidea rubescens DSM 1968]
MTQSSQQPNYALSCHSSIDEILESNRRWAEKTDWEEPHLFSTTGAGQEPHTLWIGCADSRVNEDCFYGVLPGEIFSTSNVANVINNVHDTSSQAVIYYAVHHLKVKRILIVGHTDCGGIKASLSIKDKHNTGLPKQLNTWLEPVIDLRFKHQKYLSQFSDIDEAVSRLSELNVKEQYNYLTTQDEAVVHGLQEKTLEVYGLLFNVSTGLLTQLI